MGTLTTKSRQDYVQNQKDDTGDPTLRVKGAHDIVKKFIRRAPRSLILRFPELAVIQDLI
jgi:hypothetical protein